MGAGNGWVSENASAMASSTVSSQMRSSCPRAAAGISSRSLRLRAGRSTRFRPARAAASVFSLIPPTGSTNPRRLISPVIAVSLRTVRPVKSETSAVNIATPALGPSFGVAPAGTCTWTSLFWKASPSMPSAAERPLTRVSAACALSFMTSPSCPVRMSRPLPSTRLASMKRMSPPTGVQASPVATPGTDRRMATSPSKRRGPRTGARSSTSRWTAAAVPSATCIATRRKTLPISRSRFRTPASRV